MEDHEARIEQVNQYLLHNLARIARLCERFPVPVNLPNLIASADDGLTMISSVYSAISMANDQLDEDTADAIRTVLLTWIGSFELTALYRQYPATRNYEVAYLICEHVEASAIIAGLKLDDYLSPKPKRKRRF